MNQDQETAKCQLKTTVQRIEGAYAPATIRAYRTDFEKFIDWCESHKESSLPATPEVVVAFVQALTDEALSSAYIRRIVAAVAAIHRLNRLADPTKDPDVKLEMRRMHRTLGRASKQACGITASWLDKMIAITDESLHGVRNRALLLVAYEGLLRRSELVSLRADDLVLDGEGQLARLRLRRSKTDQTAQGRWLVFTPRTSLAIRHWVEASNIQSGLLFRGIDRGGRLSDQLCVEQVNRIYKQLAKKAGLTASASMSISGHSLRVGAARDLLTSGADLAKIMAAGRWSKTDTVMRYVEQVQGAFISWQAG